MEVIRIEEGREGGRRVGKEGFGRCLGVGIVAEEGGNGGVWRARGARSEAGGEERSGG